MRKDIEEYEGLYQVDTRGNIYSLRKDLKMKQKLTTHGYKAVNLFKDGEHKTFRVHRLVALSFILNPENKSQVNHKDGNRINNSVENLEWCTNQENQRHSYDELNRKSSSYPGRKQKINKHGFQGVLEKNDGRKKKFMARININGKIKSLGHYLTAKEAGKAYEKEALKYKK